MWKFQKKNHAITIPYSFSIFLFFADQLFCGAGKCIAVEHICNGVFDCEWGQDERNCGKLLF